MATKKGGSGRSSGKAAGPSKSGTSRQPAKIKFKSIPPSAPATKSSAAGGKIKFKPIDRDSLGNKSSRAELSEQKSGRLAPSRQANESYPGEKINPLLTLKTKKKS